MRENKLICYYSDLYRSIKKELSIRILVVNNFGELIIRKNMKLQNIYPSPYAKYTVYRELFTVLEDLQSKYENIPIDIISFDKKSVPGFIDISNIEDKPKIARIQELRNIIKIHNDWNIRYDVKSKEIFKKLYSQSMIKCNGKKLKGYKLPRKKQIIRKVSDIIENDCENLVFFDVEMNCIDKVDNTLGYWEIVSIGAIKYNIKTRSISSFYRIIKPKIQTILSERCMEITGLTQREIDNGIDYIKAMGEFQRWLGNGKILFLSWGREDIKALKSNSRLKGNENQLIFQIRKRYIDFQKEFSYYYLKSNQVVSLTKALSVYDLEFNGKQHNALNDSYNLFKVYEKYSQS